MPDDVAALTDELYALPLERFVPERGVLAKALRADGRREEAAAVAALPKPSVVAWAVNQVVRSQPDLAAALWAAGDAVLGAQERVVAGEGSGADLREAVAAERRALTPLGDAGRGLMTGAGRFLGEAQVQTLIETLHAAAIDPGVRADVAAGRLAKPVQASGLGAAMTPAAAPERADPETTRARLKERTRTDDAAEAERRRTEREERTRRDAAQRSLARAERERDRARERITEAVAARDDAARRAEEAAGALDAAEADLASAHDALERAEDAAAAARREVEG